MLRLAGFSEQSITKFTIYDVNTCGGVKYDRVMEHESKATHFPATGVVIADDSEGDFNQMLSAVKKIGDDKTRVYPDEIIIAKHFKAGELNGVRGRNLRNF
jgi:hypothetical protein